METPSVLNMATVRLETSKISNWDSFHATCREAFGFPEFYGMNMNAWIDCLTYLDEGDGMSGFHLAPGEKLHIEITDTELFSSRLPEIFSTLIDCTAFCKRSLYRGGQTSLFPRA